MRNGMRTGLAFVAGCLFAIVSLTRCQLPPAVTGFVDGGRQILRDAGLLPDDAGVTDSGLGLQDANASEPGPTPRSFTASCDHTGYIRSFAVFEGTSFDAAHPSQLTAVVCGHVTGSGSPMVPFSSSQSPAGWIPDPDTFTCIAESNIYVSGNTVIVECGLSEGWGTFQTATLTLTPTST